MMKLNSSFLILGVPVFFFLSLAITLDLGTLLSLCPEKDLTPYLTARSLAQDLDLAYSRTDSDRYFREQLQRPSYFLLKQKKIISSTGTFLSYSVFYCPDLYVFALAPFVRFLSFQGVLLFHSLLIVFLYCLGFSYWKIHIEDSLYSAVYALVYYTLVLLPVLFFIPSSFLFLFACVSGALYFGIRNRGAISGAFLAIACSSSPWAGLLAPYFLSLWKDKSSSDDRKILSARFLVTFGFLAFAVWGIEYLMYPPGAVSETRQMQEAQRQPVAEIWNSLPGVDRSYFSSPSLQRVADFLFGRSIGFFLYGFPAFALVLSSLKHWRVPLIRRSLFFVLLVLVVLSVSHLSSWRILMFVSDFWILLCAFAFFLAPVLRSGVLFVTIAVLASFAAGPLLVNPMGALTQRLYYLQSFPYKHFPVELSMVGKTGLTKRTEYQFRFEGGTVYFLNDRFYREGEFLWVRGQSPLELLVETDPAYGAPQLKLQNGPLDNRVLVTLGKSTKEFALVPAGVAMIDLKQYKSEGRNWGGRFYLHGKIESKIGFVPKLLSRLNPDYRYLGCQIHLIPGSRQK